MRHTVTAAPAAKLKKTAPRCFHCGASCLGTDIRLEEQHFCCDGCRLVYELINNKGLCDYYALQDHPGLRAVRPVRKDKYAFLDIPSIAESLWSFTDGDLTIITLYIPGIHCSSCMWLLEHLQRLHPGILESRLNFSAREVTIHFSRKAVSFREVAELLATIGYEPSISLEDTENKKAAAPDRSRIYKLGVAGFCFANIMMMSFPEYLGGAALEHRYALLLRWLNLALALPVFFYSATEFFGAAWKGMKAGLLNIDAPIALAIIITFARSIYEIAAGAGQGYLDSMSGIVFFMLVGRVVQERAYRSISFHRDYKSYFPVAVTVIGEDGPEIRNLRQLRKGDVIRIQNGDIIPADGVLLSDSARIDYSFVTGESEPVHVGAGAFVYAGGCHTDTAITIRLEKPVAGSYLTSLWNHSAFRRDKTAEHRDHSYIHLLSRHFTLILFLLALAAGLFWAVNDPSRILNVVTAMLIVACPCALLLSASFTNGNLLRLFSGAGLYLRDASVIEQLGSIDTIVFDKTGTLTQDLTVSPGDKLMNEAERAILHSVARSSRHPYSRALAAYSAGQKTCPVAGWREVPGAGIEATVEGRPVRIGSAAFTGAEDRPGNVHALIRGHIFSFTVAAGMRTGVAALIHRLKMHFSLFLLSGDNDHQKAQMQEVFGSSDALLFRQSPVEKLQFIGQLQERRRRVLMIGDGLNDAGALQQSDVGIILADNVNNFSPGCDAILEGERLARLPQLLTLARAGKRIIGLSFAISICYNLAGLFFAVQGRLSPMIAAILMPASTLSIVLISTGLSAIVARMLGLRREP